MKTTKELVLERIAQQIDEQTAKGLKNYGKRLEDCDHESFDWQTEAMQELIDALSYQQMEIRRLKGQ